MILPDTKELLLEFSSRTGVSGMEGDAAQYGAQLLAPFGEVRTTALGSVACTVQKPGADGVHLLLEAHIDEIGMIVTTVGDDGFLRLAPCGGVDRRLLLASPVTVHTKEGPVDGVICSIPPHLSAGEDKKNKKVEEVYVDTGLTPEEAKSRIAPGDRVTLQSFARPLLGGKVSGKALDDRAGCACLLKVLEYLEGSKPACGLTVLFSTMEEVGGMGAKTAAYAIAPTHAIAVDVSYAHTPDAPREKCGLLGKGPMIGFAPILCAAGSDKLVALAKQEGIPYQTEVMGGKTGTDADAFVTTRGGVRTSLVSIPQKYMHMPVETVSVADVENTARLIAAYARTLTGKEAHQ